MHSARRPWIRRSVGVACVLAGLVGSEILSCGGPKPSEGPPGAFLAGSTETIAALLAQLGRLEGTPLAREAGRIAAALPDCPEVGAHDPAGDPRALVGGLRCLEGDDPLATLRRGTDPPDVLFGLPLGQGSRLRGAIRVEAGDVVAELVWSDAKAEGPLALLLPGAEAAGSGLLSPTARVLHLRVRPRGGLDLASLVPAGGQADRLFHLKSGLFAGAVLDGTWEGAVYLPERGGSVPRVALALGFRVRSLAVDAAERFLADLRASWPVQRTDFSLGAARGACLPDLNLFPGFAPCYVATDRALVAGWNPASLRVALDSAARDPDASGAPGQLEIDLSLVEQTDALLAAHLPAEERPRVAEWPWRRLRVRGERRHGDLRLRVRLEPAAS